MTSAAVTSASTAPAAPKLPPAALTPPGTVAHIAAARAAQLGPKTKSAAVDRKERALYIVTPELKTGAHLAQLMVPSCAAVLPTIPVKVVHRDSVEREDLKVIARHRVLSREAMLLVIDGIVRARFTTANYAAAQLLNAQLGRLLSAARGP